MFSMMSAEERQYLYDFATEEYTGQGAIVDLGCWLGASTTAIARGLQDNNDPKLRNTTIHAFDIFEWEPSMEFMVKGTPLQHRFSSGDNFLEEYLNQIAPWKDQVQVYAGDLTQFQWDNGSIEFLFVDAMKGWDLATSIVRAFFPDLIPGKSIVFHQDFSYYGTYWIHLVMYRLRSYFQPIKDIPNSWGLAFRYEKPIPAAELQATYDIKDFSLDEIDQAFEYSAQLVGEEKRSQIIGAKVKALFEAGEPQRAHLTLHQAIASHISDAELYLPLGLSFAAQMMSYSSRPRENEEHLKTQIQNLQAALQQTNTQLKDAQIKVDQLHATLNAMQHSKFWQLQQKWTRLKRFLGLLY
jgi:hypothetical protein